MDNDELSHSVEVKYLRHLALCSGQQVTYLGGGGMYQDWGGGESQIPVAPWAAILSYLENPRPIRDHVL